MKELAKGTKEKILGIDYWNIVAYIRVSPENVSFIEDSDDF